MMVSVETYLLRGKRRLDALAGMPWARRAGRLVLWSGGALVLAAAPGWGQMQPFAAALTAAGPGVWSLAAALGAAAGYRLFWGSQGLQGAVWTLLALAVGLAVRRRETGRPEWLALGMAAAVAGTETLFRITAPEPQPVTWILFRSAAAGGGGLLFGVLTETGSKTALWITGALGVQALSALALPLNAGFAAAGAIAAGAPLPGAALAGMGLEAAGYPGMTAGMCLVCLFRTVPVPPLWRRLLAPALGAAAGMALGKSWSLAGWLGASIGGLLAGALPWHVLAVPRQRGTGAAQVQLEQTARVMSCLQKMLLEIPEPAEDMAAAVEKLRENACSECTCRDGCRQREQLDELIFRDPLSFTCRKTGRMLREARRVQTEMRQLRGQHRQLMEYRLVLARQYGMLATWLRQVADSLPLRGTTGLPRYHAQISVRSKCREIADGDRCVAFPGLGCRYYVLLCDGMGTGLGAAAEADRAAELMKRMLTAGISARYALGSLNAQLVLEGRAGAVTADLAELRLDTGRVTLYKWGAGPSYLLRRGTAAKIGTATPPPGISVNGMGETVSRLSLCKGEILVMASDGVRFGQTMVPEGAGEDISPAELAGWLLKQYGSGEDDGTVAVIRLRPGTLAPG